MSIYPVLGCWFFFYTFDVIKLNHTPTHEFRVDKLIGIFPIIHVTNDLIKQLYQIYQM